MGSVGPLADDWPGVKYVTDDTLRGLGRVVNGRDAPPREADRVDGKLVSAGSTRRQSRSVPSRGVLAPLVVPSRAVPSTDWPA